MYLRLVSKSKTRRVSKVSRTIAVIISNHLITIHLMIVPKVCYNGFRLRNIFKTLISNRDRSKLFNGLWYMVLVFTWLISKMIGLEIISNDFNISIITHIRALNLCKKSTYKIKINNSEVIEKIYDKRSSNEIHQRIYFRDNMIN